MKICIEPLNPFRIAINHCIFAINQVVNIIITFRHDIQKGLTETREPEEDACPNVMAKPGTSLKLFYQLINGEDRVCCGCNPGTYMDQPCRYEMRIMT